MVKDLALSLLWLGVNPWPGNFDMLQMQQTNKNSVNKIKMNPLIFPLMTICY